jgi:hypothetical protein
MLLFSNKRERHAPGHRRLPDGWRRIRMVFKFPIRWSILPCLANQAGLAARFLEPYSRRRIGS